MSTYAIGDIQGCFEALNLLLEKINFDPAQDRVWLVGDLINRGPDSVEVLRWAMGLGERAVTVLGNHDLHFLAVAAGHVPPHRHDTLEELLAAPDCDAMIDWLRRQRMIYAEGDWVLVHAGLLPQWSIQKSLSLAKEVESALRGPGYRDYLANMYGSKPERWENSLTGWDRLRVIVNAMTRMRYCKPDGTMEFYTSGVEAPAGFDAWFDARRDPEQIVFGHWSQLGLHLTERVAGLDSGCVWGGPLTALRLEDRWLVQVLSPGYQRAGGKE